MKHHGYYIIFFFHLMGSAQVLAQLNATEKILLDTFSTYPEFGYHANDGYVIGGEEGSCNKATVWRLDEKFNLIKKKHLIHDFYEISEVYDMRVRDSSFEVLTRQLETEDVVSDDGVKWYSLNSDLEISDSLYVPGLESNGGILSDSTWIIKTWGDSLLRISGRSGEILQKIQFKNGYNDLIKSGSKTLSWNGSNVFIVDSSFAIDTISFDESILDIESELNDIYVLTAGNVWHLKGGMKYVIHDSIESPLEAESMVFLPKFSELAIISKWNVVHFYDDALNETNEVELFYDSIHQEDLHYQSLGDGSILRLGTTYIKIKKPKAQLYGQEFGFVQRFDQRYSEDSVKRSNLSLKELSLHDTYYGSETQSILGDSVFIITKDKDSYTKWKISNGGSDTIYSALAATNALWGYNCATAFNSHFFTNIILQPKDSLEGQFEVYENSNFPNGWERHRFLYTAYPNDHYDADFSDNLKSFTLRYIISSANEIPDPVRIQIYPNPTGDFIQVNLPPEYSMQKADIVDLQGRLVSTQIFEHAGSTIKIPALLPDGIYFLRIQTSSGYAVKKISVVR